MDSSTVEKILKTTYGNRASNLLDIGSNVRRVFCKVYDDNS